MNKILLIICFFPSILVFSQKNNNYKYVTEDQHKNKIYEKFESLENNHLKIWQKFEFTLKNDPSTDHIEYFLNMDCMKKSSVIKSIIIHWRDGNIEKLNKPSREEIITNPNSVLGGILQRHCRK